MDDIGNLVYILVFIIWFLYRVFGKGGKKPAKSMPPFDQTATPQEPEEDLSTERKPGPSTSRPVTFEDILRELTGAPPVTATREPETHEDSWREEMREPQEEASFEVMETTEPLPKKFEYDRGKFKEFQITRERSSKAARDAVKMFRSRQGAKQAFIMKEIFDRRY
jgi:hypothetical protein